MAPHSSTLDWKIPWMEEPGRLQSMGSLRVRHDWATSLSCIGEGNGNPLQCSCLENPRDSGAWWAAVYGVAQSRTRLKRLSITKEYHIKFRFFKSLWRNQTFILIFTPSQNPYRNKNVKSIDMKRVGEEIITDELSINFKHRKTDEWLNDLTGKKKLKFKSIVLKANKIFQIQA